jgi:subtilase family protein
MIAPKVPPGHVRAVVERPYDDALAAAATDLFRGEDPTRSMLPYVRETRAPRVLKVDPTFGAIPIGPGNESIEEVQTAFQEPGKSKRFLVSGFVEVGDQIPAHFDEKGEKYPIYSNPLIGGLLSPCLPTCGSSKPVGTTQTVRTKLDVPTLQANGLDGTGVGLAIVDSGIYVRRIQRLLGQMGPPTAVKLDMPNSWRPPGLVTKPFDHRLGHGTMCAYDALIAAPEATLLDFPMLLARPVADHHSTSMVDAALLAYARLAILWWVTRPFDALVVSNSWGLFHPCLEDFPPGHPYRFIDNPNHALRKYLIRPLAATGMDIVFCGNNCGDGRNCAGDCASGTCLSKTDRMIMGANTYEEVLTVGGCDTNDQMVGYSSRGPSIAGMYQNKPDLVAYTHFLGSKTVGMDVPDTGVSAACPAAAGCVAALRTRFKPNKVSPSRLFQKLRDTAYRPAGGGPWPRPDFGHGVIRPADAYQQLP